MYGDHRVLHSVPTRRSSDLTDRGGRRYPKDCSYYESAVRDAEARVVRAERDVTNAMARLIQAEDWVRKANQELNDARAEVKEAQLRVEWCQKALNYSKEGMIQAKAAHLAILYSLNMAERSYEEAQAAEISQQKATARHKDQIDRKSTRLNSSHVRTSRMPSSA